MSLIGICPRKSASGKFFPRAWHCSGRITGLGTLTMFRVASCAGLDGRRHVHAEPLIPAPRNSSWQSGGNQSHSDNPAFADFTGGTDPIPLYDMQAA